MNFAEAMSHRFACRLFRDTMVADADLMKILDWGRLTPTSFGLEGWAFHVVRGRKRMELFRAAFSQEAVRTAPVSVVLVAKRGCAYNPRGPFVAERGSRSGDLRAFIDDYKGYWEFLRDTHTIDEWSLRQCYLAAANMMTGAKTLGIDSIALEGFDGEAVLRLLSLSAEEWQVALILPFGYGAESERPKIRESLKDLVVFH